MEDQYFNLPIDEAETMYNLQNPDQEYLDFIRTQPQNLGFFPTNVAQNPAMVNYGITSLPEFDMANLPMYEKDDEQSQEYIDQVEKSQGGGIGGLLKFLVGLAVPGAGLLMNLGQDGSNKLRGGFNRGLGSLRNLNQRIQGSNFGKATSLADYLDMRKYGGYQGRENSRARTMAQARGLQKQIDQRPSAKPTAQDIARGGGRSSPSPSRTSPQSGMQAERTRSRDLGSMRGGVGR